MVSFKILAGGYDVFVATYLFNSANSSLSLLSKSPTGSNPSWITINPSNRSLLYAVNENDSGALQSFLITPNAALSGPLDTVASDGGAPAFAAALSTGSVAVMNYNSGNGRIIPTTAEQSKFVTSAPVITFPPPVGGVSHPHMALEHKDEILVPDLGGDTIWRLKENKTTGAYFIQGSLPQPTGSGPRHIAFFNNRLFCLHETASTLSVQTLPRQPNGTSTIFDTVSVAPTAPAPGAVFAAAEILIPAPTLAFPIPYIYVSNRNIGNQTATGDSIAIFEHVNQGFPNEGLRLFLVAGGFAGTAGVIVLRRTEGGSNLEIVARNLDIPTRTSFVWL
ncbi:Lactonase, 7-bladed beta-propeller-domain-containing protein [Pholiota molesta]|nr:Lactonase, 7-bladed beta-propeller-domain-containing protein [Pholiota molesta]